MSKTKRRVITRQGQKAMVEQPGTIVATSTTATTADVTFPRFPELAAELRLLIWRFALPCRVFEIRQETVSVKQDGEADVAKDLDHDAWRVRNSDLVAVLLAPPALLSVCREARRFASRTGSWKCVGSRPRGAGRVIRLATWFDPSTDTLCFDDPAVPFVAGQQIRERDGVATELANNPAVTRVYFGACPASPVCVSLAALAGSSGRFFVEQWKRKRGFWSGVPRYQYYRDSILMHLGRSPSVQEIFGRGVDRCHTLLVDARDHKKLRQLGRLYVEESDPAFFQRRVADFLGIITYPNYGYIEQSRNDLRNLWLKGQDDIPSSALVLSEDQTSVQMRSLIEPGAVLDTVQQFDHTHAWSKERIDDMPNMELVVHFRLCITNHDKEGGRRLKPVEN